MAAVRHEIHNTQQNTPEKKEKKETKKKKQTWNRWWVKGLKKVLAARQRVALPQRS